MSQRVACAGEVKQKMRSRRETESEEGGKSVYADPGDVKNFVFLD